MTEFVLCLSEAKEALSLRFANLAVRVFDCEAVGFTCCREPITSSFFMLDGPVMFTSPRKLEVGVSATPSLNRSSVKARTGKDLVKTSASC